MGEKHKIIVTGGAGLIGLETCRQLVQQGHEVRLFDLGEQILRVKEHIPKDVRIFYGSVLDSDSIRTAMRDCDIVIHLAALLGVKRSERERLRCIEINIDGTKKVLDSAVQFGVKKFVFASSSEVYGEPLGNPVKETDILQGRTVYAITKLAGEELCKAYSHIYPLKYTILRYFNCYGPFQTGQFVIAKFINNVLKGKSPVIYGSGEQIRSYTYVFDTAKATILAAVSEKADNEVFNVGKGDESINLNDLAELVIRVGGKGGEIKPEYQNFENSDRREEREILVRYCDSTKAREILNWQPEIPLEEGIRKVFEKGIIFERWENLYDEQN